MENEYSQTESVQAQTGEFKYLYVDGKEITNFDAIQIESDISDLQDDLAQVQQDLSDLDDDLTTTRQNLNARIKAVEDDISDNIEVSISANATNIATNASDINTLEGQFGLMTLDIADLRSDVDFNEDKNFEQDGRLDALEARSFNSSIVDNLSTTVQALQTRTDTLESLVSSFTNNNTNDTAIEHRISRLEKTILALKAIHDAKKSVYNIPVDW